MTSTDDGQSAHYDAPRYLTPSSDLTRNACEASQASNTWAVIVGVDRYLDPSISDLRGAVSDAWVFYHYLASPAGGRVPTGQMRLLLNQEASKSEVEGALGNFLRRSCPQDRVIIYFAGHGAPESPTSDDAFLLLHDTQSDNMVGTAISMRQLPKFLEWRTSEVGELLLLVDACHSGNIAMRGVVSRRNVTMEERRKAPRDPKAPSAVEMADEAVSALRSQKVNESLVKVAEEMIQHKWSVISAAAANQYAGESAKTCGGDARYTGGVFTCRVIEALSGAGDENQDGGVSVNELYSYVDAQVRSDTGGTQTPMFSGHSDPRTHFFKVPSYGGTVQVPSMPMIYSSTDHQSKYTTSRWITIGLTAGALVTGALLNASANSLTRDANTFLYRQRTESEYLDLIAERDATTQQAQIAYGVMGVFGLASLTLSALEYFDQPTTREDVYRVKPWFSIPTRSTEHASTSGLAGVEVSF